MNAAVYARKSNDQAERDDADKSVTRQIAHAKAFAAKQGWTVDDAHVYADDGISGVHFDSRPGYVRLLNALKPRAPFEVLIVSELSRIGREQFETGYAMKQLSQAGVKIFSYLDDREVLLDSPTDKFMLAAVNFAAEIERDKARQRVTDAMTRKARAGHMCGGHLFAYRNRAVLGPDGRRSHVEREIVEEEADVVRRIFRLCAEGFGVKGIAKLLNTDGIPSPRPKLGRPNAWAPSSVRSALHNDLYRGILTWNRRKESNSWGQRERQIRAEADWIRVDVPQLRIVTTDEWDAAHKRLQNSAAIYIRHTDGRMWGRPPSDIASKYLLSGTGVCASSTTGARPSAPTASGSRWPEPTTRS
jgi:site-specific DNA recombinase